MNWRHSWSFSTLLFLVALGAGLNACASQTTVGDTTEPPAHIPMQAFHGQGSTEGAAEAVSYRALYNTNSYIAALRQEIVLLEGGSLSSELEAFLTAKAVEEAHPKAVGL